MPAQTMTTVSTSRNIVNLDEQGGIPRDGYGGRRLEAGGVVGGGIPTSERVVGGVGAIGSILEARVRNRLDKLGKAVPDDLLKEYLRGGSQQDEASAAEKASTSSSSADVTGGQAMNMMQAASTVVTLQSEREDDDDANYDYDDDFEVDHDGTEDQEGEDYEEEDYEEDYEDDESEENGERNSPLCERRDGDAAPLTLTGSEEKFSSDSDNVTGARVSHESSEGHVAAPSLVIDEPSAAPTRDKCVGETSVADCIGDDAERIDLHSLLEVSRKSPATNVESVRDTPQRGGGGSRPVSAPISGSPGRVLISPAKESGRGKDKPTKLAERTNTIQQKVHEKSGKVDRVARNNTFRTEWSRRASLSNLTSSKPRKTENFFTYFAREHEKLQKQDRIRRNKARQKSAIVTRTQAPNEKRRDDIRMQVRKAMMTSDR